MNDKSCNNVIFPLEYFRKIHANKQNTKKTERPGSLALYTFTWGVGARTGNGNGQRGWGLGFGFGFGFRIQGRQVYVAVGLS